ncbi:hypothetical protein FACS1894166_01450 [Bacilli bacterium]|nr:hypothetical protein FACS1894166_01450 [Bacilli bacterium]
MAKYEIMLVVDGSLDEKAAKASIKELVTIIDKSKDFQLTELGLRDLAFKIKGQPKG